MFGQSSSPQSTVQNSQKTLLKWSTLASQHFCSLFYSFMDCRRSEVNRFFNSPANGGFQLSWEGNSIQSNLQQLNILFNELLPVSKHNVTSIDCHPITITSTQHQLLIITVSGFVTYGLGSSPAKGFHHTFILQQTQQQHSQQHLNGKQPSVPFHYIISATIRTRQLEETSDQVAPQQFKGSVDPAFKKRIRH